MRHPCLQGQPLHVLSSQPHPLLRHPPALFAASHGGLSFARLVALVRCALRPCVRCSALSLRTARSSVGIPSPSRCPPAASSISTSVPRPHQVSPLLLALSLAASVLPPASLAGACPVPPELAWTNCAIAKLPESRRCRCRCGMSASRDKRSPRDASVLVWRQPWGVRERLCLAACVAVCAYLRFRVLFFSLR